MGLAQLQSWGRAHLLHDRARISTSPADLVLPGVNIVHVRRCAPVHPKHVRRQAEELGVGFQAQVAASTRDPRPAAVQLTRQLRVAEVREWLEDDIAGIIACFGEQLGYPSVRAKLEVLGGTPCPRFHADHVGVRMLVTYCGPGTLFLENRHVRRRWLWGGSGGVAVEAADTAAALQAGTSDLLFLKGHSWAGNYGMGAVHRSPDVLTPCNDTAALGTAELETEGAVARRKDGGAGPAACGSGRGGGAGGGGGGAADNGGGLRLLLTVDDVVGEACGCGAAHGHGEEGEGDAHRADHSLAAAGGRGEAAGNWACRDG